MELSEIKPKLNSVVTYNNTQYILTACTIRRNNTGELFYQAELADMKASSVLIVKLDEVKS